MITKIHGTRTSSILMSTQQVKNKILMRDFVYEANLELARLARSALATENEGRGRDVDKRNIFIEDMVAVVDSDHEYNEWVVTVNMISPCGTLLYLIGMPPGRYK